MAELSPAAQAVLDAANDAVNDVIFDPDSGEESPVPMCAAAALRAAVDQVDWNWGPAQDLLARAAELEGQ